MIAGAAGRVKSGNGERLSTRRREIPRMPSLAPVRMLVADLDPEACARALDARDPRFDGLFFVGITTTGIYCRPVCPSRISAASRRRFFASAAAAERAGFRPCLRCRPELAPGRAQVDAVSRLARAAAQRIEAGALNGHTATDLAADLGVSARHLRRVLAREFGVSAAELAQTYRLLLAKRLLADTDLPVTRIAFASGFQSLRRFNEAFRRRYRMPPSALRRAPPHGRSAPAGGADAVERPLRLTLSYRPPYDWQGVLALLARDAISGVELVRDGTYTRTVRIGEHTGIVRVEPAHARHLVLDLSATLVPALMPLLPRLRRLFDLDAEPHVIDAHLEHTELAPLVRRRPGVRLPGALQGFEAVFRVLLRSGAPPGDDSLARRVACALGEPIAAGIAALTRLLPTAERVRRAGAAALAALGMPVHAAEVLARVADAVAGGRLRLEGGADVPGAHRVLLELGAGEPGATLIVLRALDWPDAFPAADSALLRAAGASGAHELLERAEPWRPWRAYAALHLWLEDAADS